MLQSLRNFFVAFLIAGLFFGTAAYFATGILVECLAPAFGVSVEKDEGEDTSEDTGNQHGTDEPADSGNRTYSILFINTAYKPSEASQYIAKEVARYPENEKDVTVTVTSTGTREIHLLDLLLMRGSESRKEFTFTYLPPSMVLSANGSNMTLDEIYRKLGISFLCRKIEAATGFDINAYAVADLEDISYLVEYINGVTYNVPSEVSTGSGDSRKVLLPAGRANLVGKDAQNLIEYSAAGSTRGQMVVSFGQAMMQKATNKLYQIDIVALFRSASNRIETTAAYTDISGLSDFFYSYTECDAVDLSYPGTYKSSNGVTVFNPSVETAIEKFSGYR